MIKGGIYFKDENEYFSDFKYYVREIITRVLRTNYTSIGKIIFNKDNKGIISSLSEELDEIIDNSTMQVIKFEKIYQIAENLHEFNLHPTIHDKKLKIIKKIIVLLVAAKNSILEEYLAVLKIMHGTRNGSKNKKGDSFKKERKATMTSTSLASMDLKLSKTSKHNQEKYNDQISGREQHLERERIIQEEPDKLIIHNKNVTIWDRPSHAESEPIENHELKNFTPIDDDQLTIRSANQFKNPFDRILSENKLRELMENKERDTFLLKTKTLTLKEKPYPIIQDFRRRNNTINKTKIGDSFEFLKPYKTQNNSKEKGYIDIKDKSDIVSLSPSTTCINTDENFEYSTSTSDNLSRNNPKSITISENMSVSSLNNNYKNHIEPGKDDCGNTKILAESLKHNEDMYFLKKEALLLLSKDNQKKINDLVKKIHNKEIIRRDVNPSFDRSRIVFAQPNTEVNLLSRKHKRQVMKEEKMKLKQQKESEKKVKRRYRRKSAVSQHINIQQNSKIMRNKLRSEPNKQEISQTKVSNNFVSIENQENILKINTNFPKLSDNHQAEEEMPGLFNDQPGSYDFNIFLKTPSPFSCNFKMFDFTKRFAPSPESDFLGLRNIQESINNSVKEKELSYKDFNCESSNNLSKNQAQNDEPAEWQFP